MLTKRKIITHTHWGRSVTRRAFWQAKTSENTICGISLRSIPLSTIIMGS